MEESSREAVVQRQLEAYNARDLEAWLATYAPNAVQYRSPAEVVAQGREAIRSRMVERFASDAAQHAELLKRTIIGNSVVDHEIVTRTYPEGVGRYELIATYEVSDGLIQSATFLFGDPVF